MPALNISVYIRNVVRGVRSSCVTDDTNAARRSLSVITPSNKNAAATAAKILSVANASRLSYLKLRVDIIKTRAGIWSYCCSCPIMFIY